MLVVSLAASTTRDSSLLGWSLRKSLNRCRIFLFKCWRQNMRERLMLVDWKTIWQLMQKALCPWTMHNWNQCHEVHTFGWTMPCGLSFPQAPHQKRKWWWIHRQFWKKDRWCSHCIVDNDSDVNWWKGVAVQDWTGWKPLATQWKPNRNGSCGLSAEQLTFMDCPMTIVWKTEAFDDIGFAFCSFRGRAVWKSPVSCVQEKVVCWVWYPICCRFCRQFFHQCR